MSAKIDLKDAIFIGIGGMVGGGIFAVLGLAVSLAKGGTPIAFLFAGIIALLTAYSYAKLSKKYPENGGTVRFVHHQFGNGIFAGGINNLLWISYIVMLALYASAFGAYSAELISITSNNEVDIKIFQTAIIVLALLINYLSIKLVSRIESVSVVVKLIILIAFIAVGFYGIYQNSENLNQLTPENWEAPILLLSGGMVIFVAYEGFELIANSISDLQNKEKNTEKAYFGAVGFVVILYILIAIVTIGALPFDTIASAEEYVLAKAAEPTLGKIGFTIITITAMISTFSAINATVLGSGRVNFDIAKDDELPKYFSNSLWGKPVGFLITAILAIALVNTIDLESISTAGSSGFLLIFTIVNYIGYKKYKTLKSNKFIHLFAAIICAIAFATLLLQQFAENKIGVFSALSIIALSFLVEFVYKSTSKV
ncbi:APC family permease [Polaribacter dokdonensis]|uniref:Amino acid permease n=1 Tax=Polaribacter dokdonensis DSW-5 TaxID=1300348 RepID=A0A0N0UNF2_9FLAO|nr:APC family permease [Polaribacter dokdonensis]KOY51448.1 Amino acid permease [Polaribacter dokdonensis DSW-5]SEE11117.1 amino acid:proton symporter, ABT family [Polaribacter dokdonensis DSW-5]